jgi:hypothetical protein
MCNRRQDWSQTRRAGKSGNEQSQVMLANEQAFDITSFRRFSAPSSMMIGPSVVVGECRQADRRQKAAKGNGKHNPRR